MVMTGDVMDLLPTLPADSFDAMLTDPPYGIEFMGRDWDKVVPGVEVWSEVLRVLKPGAFALVFGGTRTFHRLAVALEDAGFELRDTLMWVYGSGFPKSFDVSKAIDKAAGAEREVVGGKEVTRDLSGGSWADLHGKPNQATVVPITAPATPDAERWQGYGTALKPAWEPVLLVRKPTPLTYAANAIEHGAGALNIDGGRVPYLGESDRDSATPQGRVTSKERGAIGASPDAGRDLERVEFDRPELKGRWPANLIHDGSEEVVAHFPQSKDGVAIGRSNNSTGYGGGWGPQLGLRMGYGGEGSAARFFYSAKASKSERNAGVERNGHPTVKPLALTEYLAKLLLPPERDTPRRILIPFAGSGSELIGALKAGWEEATGIERDAEYAAIAHERIEHWTKQPQLLTAV